MSRQTKRSFILGAVVLGAGAAVMLLLISLKKAPAEATETIRERTVPVTAIEVEPEDVVVTVTGYGEARPRRTVDIAPEISGSVISVHPNLVVGGLIHEGETLFALDDRKYRVDLSEAEARLSRGRAALARIEAEWAGDRERLETLQRTAELAKSKYDRAAKLMAQAIGNQTAVDEAEEHYNSARDQLHQLQQRLTVYPIEIEESRQSMNADSARKERAEIDLSLARVAAPFDARVTRVKVEQGHFAQQGFSAVSLADDSTLEIPIKIDAGDARSWLKFNGHTGLDDVAWFTEIVRSDCQVRWTEDSARSWTGRLERVERFDPASRTLTVVASISADEARSPGAGRLPLVAGMFCEVEIPGRTLEGVYVLPQSTVTVDKTIYVAKEGRLSTLPIELLRTEGDSAYVSGSIRPGETVITTRLINPIENTLLDVQLEAPAMTTRTD